MSSTNMEKFIRNFRERLGLNQHQFADLIGRSYASVQGYEAGKRVSAAVVERMEAIARERGIDLATLPADGQPSTPQRSKPDAPPRYRPENQRWHDALERILNSGMKTAIDAVVPNLVAFNALVDRHQPKPEPKKKTERIG